MIRLCLGLGAQFPARVPTAHPDATASEVAP